ncbi:MAG: hypothetical protein OEZ06_03255 [Myxococcales bacterium]|nr:hypothetical protein [Myxococcales bacterium]
MEGDELRAARLAALDDESSELQQELSGWLAAVGPEVAFEELSRRYGPADGRTALLSRAALVGLADERRDTVGDAAAAVIERLAAARGDAPRALCDRYLRQLGELRDRVELGLEGAEVNDRDPEAEREYQRRRAERLAESRALTIRADLSATATRLIVLLAGAWLLGLRMMEGLGWGRSLAVALAVGLSSSALHRLLLRKDDAPPATTRERFALVQPWIISVAVQGALLGLLSGSGRLSFWATLLGLAFTRMMWPTAAAVAAWKSEED